MELEKLRKEIDRIDQDLIKLLSKRLEVSQKIALYKKENSMQSLQVGRWKEVLESRISEAQKLGLDSKIIEEIWEIIHIFSIKKQDEILN